MYYFFFIKLGGIFSNYFFKNMLCPFLLLLRLIMHRLICLVVAMRYLRQCLTSVFFSPTQQGLQSHQVCRSIPWGFMAGIRRWGKKRMRKDGRRPPLTFWGLPCTRQGRDGRGKRGPCLSSLHLITNLGLTVFKPHSSLQRRAWQHTLVSLPG